MSELNQHKKEANEYAATPKRRTEKSTSKASLIFVIVILIGVAVLMFTGNIEVKCEDTSLRIHTTYWSDLDISYSEIDTAAYRKNLDVGTRTNGLGSARLSLGNFKNEEFGSYTLYAYASAKEYIVLTSGEKTLVIGMSDAKDTQAIYVTLLSKLGE